jgi:ribulose 1,5-bisphosphate synthetase/thiazole synthase
MNNELNELKAPYDVVIVGSGYSGTMVAVHLARAQRGLRVALIHRSKTFGRGVAYGATDPKHLLNVPADQMDAQRVRVKRSLRRSKNGQEPITSYNQGV